LFDESSRPTRTSEVEKGKSGIVSLIEVVNDNNNRPVLSYDLKSLFMAAKLFLSASFDLHTFQLISSTYHHN